MPYNPRESFGGEPPPKAPKQPTPQPKREKDGKLQIIPEYSIENWKVPRSAQRVIEQLFDDQ